MTHERPKLFAVDALTKATAVKRRAHIQAEKMVVGGHVYFRKVGRIPFLVESLGESDPKSLILLSTATASGKNAFFSNPLLYTTEKPAKPKKEAGRHR